MTGVVLTINAGSSSIKFSVYDAAAVPRCRIIGQIEGLGASVHCKAVDEAKTLLIDRIWPAGQGPDSHASALAEILAWLEEELPGVRVEGVGHRIVHGGRDHTRPALIDDELVAELAKLTSLAPLHQPHNLAGVAAAREHFPDAPQVACFDTAFHRTQAFVAEAYALPRSYYEEGVRRYGFHGLSYEYVGRRLAAIAPLEAPAASSSPISAMAARWPRSGAAARSPPRSASRRSTACRWERGAARSTPASCFI